MDLKAFIAKTVRPGEPMTAQAWNDIVSAVDDVFQFLQATRHTVKVKVTLPAGVTLDPRAIRVSAVSAAGTPFEAVAPVPPGDRYLIVGLEPGPYTLRAEAGGFTPATATVTITDSGETNVDLALAAAGAFMPDVFGLALADARKALSDAQITLSRLWDCGGEEILPSNPGSDNDTLPVFIQSPSAGTLVGPGDSAALVIAVPSRVQAAIKVPALSGLTQAEARKALEAVGLVLGDIEIRES